MVAFEFGQRPAFGQRVVDERHSSHGLQTHYTDCEQAQQTVPGGEVGFTIQVLVVSNGCHAQDCTRHTETLQDPVNTAFCLVGKPFDGGAMGGEEEYGFCHEEGELTGKERELMLLIIIDLTFRETKTKQRKEKKIRKSQLQTNSLANCAQFFLESHKLTDFQL